LAVNTANTLNQGSKLNQIYLILASLNRTRCLTTGSNLTNANLSGHRDGFLRVV